MTYIVTHSMPLEARRGIKSCVLRLIQKSTTMEI